jgi:2-dehydro-3-deoxygluconokinase
MTVHEPLSGQLVTVGEAMVCFAPTDQVAFETALSYQAFPAGAELNTCIAVRRLGMPASLLTRLGDDGPGRIVQHAMATSGIAADGIEIDRDRRTGLYLREWLPDGVRRVTYYRRHSAATALGTLDLPMPTMTAADIALLTGITVALGPGPRHACERLLAGARASGATVCFDPNYRPALWESEGATRNELLGFVRLVDVLLLSEDDSALLFGSTDPDIVLSASLSQGPQVVVFKQGALGASVATSDNARFDQPAAPVDGALDPVGAGDGFNGGFIAGLLAGLRLEDAARLGAYVGARAVEAIGDNAGYPLLAELPDDLRALLELRHDAGTVHRNVLGVPVES